MTTTIQRKRRWWKVIINLLVVLLIAYIGVSSLVVYKLTQTQRRAFVAQPQRDGLLVEDVLFPSALNDINLSGWLLTNPDDAGRVVILVHGHNSGRDDPVAGLYEIARDLLDANFSVLMFDLRGYGESEGDRFSLGWYEQHDVRGAVDFVESRGYTKIGVLGTSMGGASSLLAVTQEPEVDALVVDSAYSNLPELLEIQIPERSGLPSIFNPGVSLMANLMYDIEIEQVIPAEAAAALAPRPLLVIHGSEDHLIDPANAPIIWHARYGAEAQPDETLMLVPGADHVSSYHTNPDLYIERVTTFFNQHLN